jgi:hypothetical protein
MGEVMAQIESDLSEAKALLPAVTFIDFRDTVMNKVNVAAYQARVALYKKDYDNAVTYATEVISSGIKPLASGAQFSAIWTDDVDDEILFRIRYATSTAIGGLWTTTGGNIYIAPSDKLVSSYVSGDIRLSAYIGTNGAGNKYVKKFFSSSRGGRVVDLKACRTSEMYLIRAEANAKKASPDLTAASADINFLRSKRITGYTDQTFPTASSVIDATLQERYKELAFEGFRLFDLKRWGLGFTRGTPQNLGAINVGSNYNTINIAATDPQFVWGLPTYEININTNLVQNKGW